MSGYQFGGKAYGHPRLAKQRQLRSQERRKRKKEIVSVSVFSTVLSLHLSPCPQIWNIEKVGRQASEAQREKDLERERKNKGETVFCWRNNLKFCTGGEKMRNACFHQGENERREKKSEQEHVQNFPHKTCNQKVSGSFTL